MRTSHVTLRGSQEKWRVARGQRVYTSGTHLVEFHVLSEGLTSNSWRLCVGVIPRAFSVVADKIWVGAQRSWGYIAGASVLICVHRVCVVGACLCVLVCVCMSVAVAVFVHVFVF